MTLFLDNVPFGNTCADPSPRDVTWHFYFPLSSLFLRKSRPKYKNIAQNFGKNVKCDTFLTPCGIWWHFPVPPPPLCQMKNWNVFWRNWTMTQCPIYVSLSAIILKVTLNRTKPIFITQGFFLFYRDWNFNPSINYIAN